MSSDSPKKKDLLGWLNPASDDFCGSGMTMTDWLTSQGIARFKNSWTNQDRKEQDRRFHFITEMTLEMRRVQETHGTYLEGDWYVQSGIAFNLGIKAVIEGSKECLKEAISMCNEEGFTWNFGSEEAGKHWGDIYAPFNKLCQDCLDSWPTGREMMMA